MNLNPLRLAACLIALAATTGYAAVLKWSDMRNPCKSSAEDGVTKLGAKIGKFVTLPSNEQWAHAIFNVNNRSPGSRPWVTVAVGEMPDARLPGPDEHERYLAYTGEPGVDVFLEIMPRKTNDVLAAMDTWLGRFKHHPCVKGFGVDLEYYKRVDDDTAKACDEKIKSHNPGYRLFLKHWETDFLPPAYRGKGDLIFIDTSSEAPVQELNTGCARWAAHFAPSACAFQIGYPADEDGMDGSNATGWWKLPDPIKDWGNSLLSKIEHSTQEPGILWVCVKSGKTCNANWDLTKGATLPARKASAVTKRATGLACDQQRGKEDGGAGEQVVFAVRLVAASAAPRIPHGRIPGQARCFSDAWACRCW